MRFRRTAIVLGLAMVACTSAMAQSVLYVARPAIALSVSDRTAGRQPPVAFTVTMPDGKTTTATATPRMGGERGAPCTTRATSAMPGCMWASTPGPPASTARR